MSGGDEISLPGRNAQAGALAAYERVADPPLLILALAMIPLIGVPLAVDLSSTVDGALFATDWVIWAVFGVDLGVRTYLSPRRLNYLTTHWFDVLIVVVPFLRPLRALRSTRVLRLLRLSRAGLFATAAAATAKEIGQRHGMAYVLAVAVIALFASAALIFAFERNAGGSIDDFGTALWWAMATITTVGYGDAFPVTPEGRGIAVFLMIIGISLFGFLTANIAAFLVSQDKAGTSLDDIAAKLDLLETEVRALRQEVARSQTDGGIASPEPAAASDS